MAKEIVFKNRFGLDIYPPKPAIKDIPFWYKKQEEYISGKKIPNPDPDQTSSTIKKCIPVFDSMTVGYILYTQVDVYIYQKDGFPYYQWAHQNAITFHDVIQAPTHPINKDSLPYPKWMNPYAIKTAPGYSSLFVQPFHRESVFTILPGVVDTDSYNAPVNFPFVLNDINYEGIIPAGTPMAQVIPFKRDSFKMRFADEKETKKMFSAENIIPIKFFNKYKTMFWHRKEYK